MEAKRHTCNIVQKTRNFVYVRAILETQNNQKAMMLHVEDAHMELYVCILSLASSITGTLPPPHLSNVGNKDCTFFAEAIIFKTDCYAKLIHKPRQSFFLRLD